MDKHTHLPVAVMLVGLAAFLVGSVGMSLRVEPFYTWYYCFAWWPYILVLESVLAMWGGYSLLYDRPRRFLGLLPLSVTVWLVFEAFNFRLGNWHYLNVPASLPLRWLGYALAYATVLPALSVTVRLLEFMGVLEGRCTVRRLRDPARLYAPMAAAGALMLVLPLLWPRYFFPLVWGGFVLLLEPWLHAAGGRSLLRSWQMGDLRRACLTLLAGLVCGGLWETWNFWAGSKWYYTVPFVGTVKLFEMPVLGFLGFPPFALECAVLVAAWNLLRERMDQWPRPRRVLAWSLLVPAVAAFDLAVMAGIDRFTVDTFRTLLGG